MERWAARARAPGQLRQRPTLLLSQDAELLAEGRGWIELIIHDNILHVDRLHVKPAPRRVHADGILGRGADSRDCARRSACCASGASGDGSVETVTRPALAVRDGDNICLLSGLSVFPTEAGILPSDLRTCCPC